MIKDNCKAVTVNLETSQLSYRRHFDKKARMRTLKIGDQVLVTMPRDYNNLLMHLKGRYEVIKKGGLTNYRIQIGNNTKIFHLNMLKKYISGGSSTFCGYLGSSW